MTFQEYAQSLQPKIKDAITKQIDKLRQFDLPNVQAMADDLLEYTFRGKMLRAVFVCLMTESFGRKVDDDVLATASALELAQSALLIHDDVMDQDDMRRNAPSIHKIYEDRYRDRRTGESLAICLGDVSLLWLFQAISFSPDLVQLFAQESVRTVFGQSYEIASANSNRELDREEILTIIKNKTAHYTFYLPFAAGMVLANKKIPTNLLNFSHLLGYIFQIKDDELNILQNEDTQKSLGGDIRENKKTLCRLEIIEYDKDLIQYFGEDHGIDIIQNVYKNNVQKKIQTILDLYFGEAHKELSQFEFASEYVSYWQDLLSYLRHRSY